MVNMVLSLPSPKRFPNLTKGLRNVTSPGQTPLWGSKMCSRATTEWPGNKCFMSTFQSPLMQWCQCWLRKIAIWKRTSIKHFSSLFSRRWTRKSLGIGSTSTCSLGETMLSRDPWCKHQSIIFEDLKRWFVWQKLSQQETCNRPTKCYNPSGFTCLSTLMITQSMLKADDAFAMRHLSLLQNTLRTFSTLKWWWLPCK